MRVDVVCDNAGVELLSDLVWVDFLLAPHPLSSSAVSSFIYATQVTLHLKAYPTFVSDATPSDVLIHLQAMMTEAKKHRKFASSSSSGSSSDGSSDGSSSSDGGGGGGGDENSRLLRKRKLSTEHKTNEDMDVSPLLALHTRLASYLDSGRLVLRGDAFWDSPHVFLTSLMPDALVSYLQQSTLVILKGDGNYKRALSDHMWPETADFREVTQHFPCKSLIALRTNKSDPIVGLSSLKVEELDKADKQWRVNGKRGIIQAKL